MMAKANPTMLQNVGEKPSEPKLFPIDLVKGINFSLNLLSKYYPLSVHLSNILCYIRPIMNHYNSCELQLAVFSIGNFGNFGSS